VRRYRPNAHFSMIQTHTLVLSHDQILTTVLPCSFSMAPVTTLEMCPVPAFVGAARESPVPHSNSWPDRVLLAPGPSANRKSINQQNIFCFCAGKVRETLY
jgi:hypothetical protein